MWRCKLHAKTAASECCICVVCACACTCVCTCVCACACVCACVQRYSQGFFFSGTIFFFFLKQYLTGLELADLDKQLQGFAHLRLPRAKIVHACHQVHLFLHGCWGSSLGPRVCAPGTLIADRSISPEQTNQPLKAQRSSLGFSSEKQYQSESHKPKIDKTSHHVQVSWLSC